VPAVPPLPPLPPSVRRIVVARALRGLVDGGVAVLLPAHLLALGHDAFAVGAIATATLLGSALLTLAIGLAPRVPPRSALLAGCVLMAATGLGFAGLRDFGALLVIAFAGTLNPSSGDVSLFLPLEHVLLARLAHESRRTEVFARYATAGALAGAFGALAAGLPDLLAALGWLSREAGLRGAFALYAATGCALAALYQRVEAPPPAAGGARGGLGRSRSRVLALALLFSLDAFGGGFVVHSLLALWLFQRFGLSLGDAALLFFAIGLGSALSQLAAPALARRIGLLGTMVGPHLVANACLAALAFAPSLPAALALLGLRSLLSSLDVPARSAYVMSVVGPEERAAAASLTNVPRSLAAAAAPALAGWLLATGNPGAPLFLAGLLKATYDVLLFASFRTVRPA
jgi:predicted MFS family arabinose efflux permease